MRITAPTYTQTPNDLFDHWLPHLTHVELKVLLVIMRKTFGWHKVRDKISLSQLEKLTGSTQTSVSNAIKSLIEKGVIKKEIVGILGKEEVYYELIVNEDSNNSYPSCDRSPTPPIKREVTPPMAGDTKQSSSNTFEQQQQPVVVVVPQNEESLAILMQTGFDQKTASYLSKYPIDRIRRQIENLQRQKEILEIDNPLGWLRLAIENDWQLPEPKEDYAEKAAKLREEQLQERHSIKTQCEKLYDKHEKTFTVNNYFDIGIDVISCKSGEKHFFLPYDESCVKHLETFINKYLRIEK